MGVVLRRYVLILKWPNALCFTTVYARPQVTNARWFTTVYICSSWGDQCALIYDGVCSSSGDQCALIYDGICSSWGDQTRVDLRRCMLVLRWPNARWFTTVCARPQVTMCGLRGFQNPIRTVSRTVLRCFCPGPLIPWTCACVITSVGCSWMNFEYWDAPVNARGCFWLGCVCCWLCCVWNCEPASDL